MVKINLMIFLNKKKYLFLSVVISVLFFSGCAPKKAMMEVDVLVASGHYKAAAQKADSHLDKSDKYDIDNLLWHLENGSSLLYAEENNVSIDAFNESEYLMKHYREQILASDVSQTLSSILINDTTRPYIGSSYDGVMLNTYKAINYMSLDDMDAARVEFNRAVDRQRRAKVFFAEMIDKEREAIEHKESQENDVYVSKSMQNPDVGTRLEQGYPSLHAFEAYPDFVNPMTTYLAGIFSMANGEYEKAHTLLKESYGMMGDNLDVQADFQEVELTLESGKKVKEPMVWVIFENGQAPILQEWRIDLPVFIVSSKLNYISVALPRLVERKKAYEYLSIVTNKDEHLLSRHLCSMDRVIKTEFEKEYESIVRRAILSVATKTTIQYALQEQHNNNGSNISALISMAATVYQIASTQADTRIWSTLPKEFQLARFVRPDDGNVQIMTPDGKLISRLELPKRENVLIYVKIATPNAVASVSVIPFGRR